ncbi:MAG: nucleotide-binding protein [Parasulfuritortus sp.]|jgi:hypothetical protein|nr:nucleotide-binding protein [Parasulfuritortus sp.]
MKKLIVTCIVAATVLYAPANSAIASVPAPASEVKGQVLEVKDVQSYTYLRLKTKDGETWAAVSKASVKKGADVTLENVMVMHDFKSQTLNKTFPTILFGTLAGTQGAGMGSASQAKPEADAHVDKARGANAYTVAEVIAKNAELKDKTVLVRGKVVKYNPEIMKKNWVHLRDGSGSAAAGTNDLLVTTNDATKVGDIVTAKGIVRTNKDFGAGYAYKVMIEQATLQK